MPATTEQRRQNEIKEEHKKNCPVINNEDSWWRLGITFIVLYMMAKIIGQKDHINSYNTVTSLSYPTRSEWAGGSLHKNQKNLNENSVPYH